MEGTNLDCEQFKCCKLPHIKVWSQTKYARSHVSPTLISVRDLLHNAPLSSLVGTAHDESTIYCLSLLCWCASYIYIICQYSVLCARNLVLYLPAFGCCNELQYML